MDGPRSRGYGARSGYDVRTRCIRGCTERRQGVSPGRISGMRRRLPAAASDPSKIGRRPSNPLSSKPTNQTEKRYGRRERRDNKTNAEAGIKNTRSWAGPNHRDNWQNERGFDNANALPSIEDIGNHRPSQGKQENIWKG